MLLGLLSVLLVVGACANPPPPKHNGNTASLGELVFRVLRAKLQGSKTCPTEYLTALDAHHTDFVSTVNYTISDSVVDEFPDLLGGTIQPLVSNGALPDMVHELAAAMGLLISDSFDPNRDTLKSLVHLANARTMLEDTMVFDLVDAVLSDPTLPNKVHSLALLAQEWDGVDFVVDDGLGLVATALQADTSIACTGLTIPDLQTTVFRTSGFVEDASLALGAPAYSARPDVNFNPRVRVDTATGKLAAPFVDTTPADGVADVNATGYPIDANGQVIDIPIIGVAGRRDAYGRALNANGGLLYEYFDVKRTALSYAAQIAADFVANHLHRDIPTIANAALGTAQTCTYGTPLATCREYGSANNPVADVYFLGTDILRYPQLVSLLDALQTLLTADPNKAESLLMTVGDVVNALDASTLSLTDTALLDAGAGLLPLADQLFKVSNTSGQSTPRLLADVIRDMGVAKAQIPRQIGYLVEFQTVTNMPTASVPPTGTRVDYAKTRFPSVSGVTIDNRSSLEQLVDLLGYADCGYIGTTPTGDKINDYLYIFLRDAFPGRSGSPALKTGTLAEVLVEAASRADANTLKTLLGLASWFSSQSGGINSALTSLGCTASVGGGKTQADAIAAHLTALDSVKNTGVLDWVLPVAKVFVAQGQSRTLLNMGKLLAADLQKDGSFLNVLSNTPVTTNNSAIRRIEPPLLAMVKSGAVDRILGALDTLYTIQVGTAGDNAVDLLLDVASYFVVNGSVTTRQGVVTNTSRAAEFLKVWKTLATRINAASAGDELSRLIHFVTGYVQRTEDLGGGARRLKFRNLRVLLSTGTGLLHDAAQLSPTNFKCYVDALQSKGVDFLVKRDFATITRILTQVLSSPNGAAVEDWIVSLLRGMPSNPNDEPYGELLQVAAAVLSSDPKQITDQDLVNVTHWLSGVTAQTTGSNARRLIATLDAIIVADSKGAFFQIARNAINPGPLMSRELPISTFFTIYSDVGGIDANNMCMAAPAELTVPQIESTISNLIEFVNDDVNGLDAIWRLVGIVPPEEPAP